MTTNNDDFDDFDDEGNDNSPKALRARVKQLEKENKRIAELEQENNRFKQIDTVRAAGLGELSERQIKALVATHDGDMTPELLRATAEDLKFVDPIPEVPQAEQQAHAQLQDARAGNDGSGAAATYEEELASAKNADEVIAISQKHNKPVLSA